MNLKAFRSAATLSFSVALAGVMFAQGSPSQPTTGQPSQGMQSMDGQTVTVTGCLVRASDLRGGATAAGSSATTPGTTPSTPPSSGTTASASGAAGGDFVLANVQMRNASPGGAASGSAASGAAETAPSGKSGMNLQLKGSEDNKLTEHVNQRVEVTGRLSMKHATSGSTTGATSGTPGTTGTTPRPGATPTPGTTGSSTTAGSAMSGHGQHQGELQVQTIRATGQACTAGGGQ